MHKMENAATKEQVERKKQTQNFRYNIKQQQKYHDDEEFCPAYAYRYFSVLHKG